MTEFKPLDFGRLLDADDQLDVYEYAVLNAMARGTDNSNYRVRRSLSAIARAAKVHRDTVSDMLDRPQVSRYLDSVERMPRRVEIRLRQSPHADPSSKGEESTTSEPKQPHADPTGKTCRPEQQDMPTGAAPSASFCSLSAQKADPRQAPCFCDGGCELCVPERCWDHGGVQIKATCQHCHNIASRERSESKHPDFKRKGWHDDRMAEEGLNEFGEPMRLEY